MDKTEELIKNLVKAYADTNQYAVLLKKWDIFGDLIEEVLDDATGIQECFNPSDYVISADTLHRLREAWRDLIAWEQEKKHINEDTEE
jgi:hypothetical protein